MKTSRIDLLASLTIIALALSSSAPVSMAEKNRPVVTKKELKVLLRTAKEPPEHRKIAEYYRHEAERLTASSKEHSELAVIYEKHPPFPTVAARPGSTFFGQGVNHCKRLAELYAEKAKEAEALAALHEEMAKAADEKR